MDKVTPALGRLMYNRAVVPVIVEARSNRFKELSTELRKIVPVDLLQPMYSALPRVLRVFEVSLTKWKELESFNMIATALTRNLIEDVAKWDFVERIYSDNLRYALQYTTVPREGMYLNYRAKPFTSTFWVKKLLGLDIANGKGYIGKDVKVAVLDTGCNVTLPQVRHVKVYSAMIEKGGTGLDQNGHGTWCVSCVGGRAETDPRYKAKVEGMALGCGLNSIQVLGFIIGMGMQSDILQGMEMALRLGAKVVSMSLGGEEAPPDADNPEAKAVDKLTENGTIVVVAAGNSGDAPSTVGSPGCCRNALTVGCIDPLKGELAKFSSRGPTRGDGLIKPDVVSYGVQVDSQTTGLLDRMIDATERFYAPMSGTSMATPVCAGLIASMFQLYREKLGKDLTVGEVKKMMEVRSVNRKDNNVGWGILDWGTVEWWVSTQYGVGI